MKPDDYLEQDDIVPGSAREAWDNFHKTIEKHGNYGIVAVASLGVIFYLICMLILSLVGIE